MAGASGDGAVFLHADSCGGAVGESLASVDREAVDVSRLLSLFDWRGKVLVVCAMLSVRLAGHAKGCWVGFWLRLPESVRVKCAHVCTCFGCFGLTRALKRQKRKAVVLELFFLLFFCRF